MKLIKKLPSVKDGKNVRAFGLYECTKCFKHERKRTDTVKRLNTKLCKSCSAREKATTHGYSYHPLYNTWKHQQERCEDSKNKDYKYYGARGISFCTTWKNFEVWLAHISTLPKTKETSSLDRIDNDGNYVAGNLRWATKTEQAINRRKPQPKKKKDEASWSWDEANAELDEVGDQQMELARDREMGL